ncbi:MAG: hypothetical protein KAJ16_13315 [Calditrichia bacterium]|nr:hypothetical protein [Calditrichia bacterium]
MKNLLKNTEIFRCIHESHRGYKNKVSVYHILKEKSCFPHGCVYFRWKCKQLSKRSKCHRGYSYVGRKCPGCKDYYEEKIHNYPELQISEHEFKNFMKELLEFEDWIEECQLKPIEFAGTVAEIKPHFRQKIYPKTKFLSFHGYIAVLNPVFLGWHRFEDPVYAYFSSKYFQKLRFGKGAEIEGIGEVTVDRGRLIMRRTRNIEITQAGEEIYWNEQRVLLSRETATEFRIQPETCVGCQFGALVDVEYLRDHHSHSRRKLFCLKGMADFRDCYMHIEYCGLDNEADAKPEIDCLKKKSIIMS